MTKNRVAYIHGRLGPHIMHGRLAKSIGGEFQMVDKYKIWNDGIYPKLYTIYAWFYNAFAFEKPSQYDYFLVSGPHFSPIIMKWFRLNKKQKVIAHLGDETMYFLYDRWYSKFMRRVLILLLNQYDALFCEGQMAADLARLNHINKPKVYTTYLGVPKERRTKLLEVQPDYSKNHFVFISTGPRGWRTYYKGLDLMINAFRQAFEEKNDIEFSIIGNWDEDVQEKLLEKCSDKVRAAIHFLGHTDDIDAELGKGCFYLHTARGDAFPTVVLEGMTAGLIPLVSEWTGSKEVVSKVDSALVVSLNEDVIAQAIIELTNLKIEKRVELSKLSREAAQDYTEEFALNHYQKTFNRFISESR